MDCVCGLKILIVGGIGLQIRCNGKRVRYSSKTPLGKEFLARNSLETYLAGGGRRGRFLKKSAGGVRKMCLF